MTKFYTDKKKRVRPISNRTTTIGSYQTGTAHLSVPKKITSKNQFNKQLTVKATKIIKDEWNDYCRRNFINTPTIKKVVLVGSRAKGTNRKDSDADFKILIDSLPVKIHVNPKTGEQTELTHYRHNLNVDFQNENLRDVTVDEIPIDVFFVTDMKQSDFLESPYAPIKRR